MRNWRDWVWVSVFVILFGAALIANVSDGSMSNLRGAWVQASPPIGVVQYVGWCVDGASEGLAQPKAAGVYKGRPACQQGAGIEPET
jgi:hypothetical protein